MDEQDQYERMAGIFKALSDPKRVRILDVLSEGEKCACALLHHFQITQPTLSHDLKLLIGAGIVKSRRDGQRTLYSLNMDALKKMQNKLKELLRSDGESPDAT